MTVEALLTLFVAVPLLAGGLTAGFSERHRLCLVTLFVILTAQLTAAAAAVWWTAGGDTHVTQVALWPAGVAIPFVVDAFAALMLLVTSLLTLVCCAFSVAAGEARRRFFPTLVLIVACGVNGALLTGDVFNFFVFIEVMLLASYGLMMITRTGHASLAGVAASRLYVTVNLLTSTSLLIGVALLYGVTGTVNTAELHGAAAEDPRVAIAATLVLLSLSVKAAVVPVHGWLSRVYPKLSPGITALFSGLHTKVAIYMIYRVYAVLFDGDERFLWVGVVLFCATMTIGVLGAVGEKTPRAILAFHMVSQIGYILLGVALFGPIGLTAGIFYLLHHMIVKASLFLSIGAVEVRYGPRRLGQLQGLGKVEPLVAIAFFAAAMSLAGIPPFSGFVAKLSLIMAAYSMGQIAAVVVMIVVSLITLLSMLKIWTGIFLGDPEPVDDRTAPDALIGAEVHYLGDDDPADDESADSDEAAAAESGRALARTGSETATGTVKPPAAAATTIPAEMPDPTAPASTLTLLPVARRISVALAAPALVLAAITLCLGLGGQLLLDLSETAAYNLYDPSGYVEAVMGP